MLKSVIYILISFVLGIYGGLVYLFLFQKPLPAFYSPIIESVEKLVSPAKHRVGYLPYWLIDKASSSYKNELDELSYFSLGLNPDGSIQKLVNDQEEEPGWTTLKSTRVQEYLSQARADGLTTSLTIFAAAQENILDLVATPSAHAQNLIADITPIMQQYKFFGIHLDVEGIHEVTPEQQAGFTQFAQELKQGLVQNKLGPLTIDITVSSLFNRHLTDPIALGKIADKIVLMTYDYHYIGSLISGPVAPLGGFPSIRPNDISVSLRYATQLIPAEKLLMGIPLYGYQWETLSGKLGSATIPRSGQTASDRRVEELLQDCENCITGRDQIGDEPYVIFPQDQYFDQIYYTDTQAIQNRLNLATAQKTAGVALWALGYEGNTTLAPLNHF